MGDPAGTLPGGKTLADAEGRCRRARCDGRLSDPLAEGDWGNGYTVRLGHCDRCGNLLEHIVGVDQMELPI